MVKVQYKGYRVWAIIQTSGKYRACFYLFPFAVMADVIPIIESDTEAEAIDKAKEYLDGIPELYLPPQRGRVLRALPS